MAVITISRTFGSGGDEIAFAICRALGYQLFDKTLVIRAAREAGFSGRDISDLSEDTYIARSFIERIFERVAFVPYIGITPEELDFMYTLERQLANEKHSLRFVQEAIEWAFGRDQFVIVGRGGQIYLKDRPGTLHIRVDAPVQQRIARVIENARQEKSDLEMDSEIDPKIWAKDVIEERDAASADYIRRFYLANWAETRYYHLILNTGRIDINRAVKHIAWMVEKMDQPVKT